MRASACAWLGPRDRNPARHHVVGADGADLLAAVLGGETVEAREDVAEQRHHRLGLELLRHRGEPDDVGKEHADPGVVLGDDPPVVLEYGRHLPGEDVEQQALGLGLFGLEHAEREIALPDKIVQRDKGDGGHTDHVHPEEHRHRRPCQVVVQSHRGLHQLRYHDEPHEAGEPPHGPTPPRHEHRPKGASNDHRITALALTKPPSASWRKNGRRRMRVSCTSRNTRYRRVIANTARLAPEAAA